MSIATSMQPEPVTYQQQLRSWFLYHLVRSHSFESKTKTVRDHWHRLVERTPELADVMLLADLPAGNDPDDELNRYIFEIRRVVSQELRCRYRGAAAPWVCQALHAVVSGQRTIDQFEIRPLLWIGNISIGVSSLGVAVVGSYIGRSALGDKTSIENEVNAPFRLWKKLRKAAHAEVDRVLDAIREEQAQATKARDTFYRKGWDTKRDETMPKLVAWLVEGEEQFAGDRTATHALLHELQMDPPVLSKKFDGK